MKRIVLLSALTLAGCNLTPGQQVLVASAVTTGGCLLADVVTGAGVTATQITLPATADPAASKTLNRWKAGQAVSQTQCIQLANALQATGQQIVALEIKNAPATK